LDSRRDTGKDRALGIYWLLESFMGPAPKIHQPSSFGTPS